MATKTAKKAAAKKTPRKKAARKKAPRKKAPAAGIPDPMEENKRLSEMDRLRFVALDNELRALGFEQSNVSQEEDIDRRNYEARKLVRQQRNRQINQTLRIKAQEQKQLLVELGGKYDFDPGLVSIDDVSGIVHEHSKRE
jgi:hypothetical protein